MEEQPLLVPEYSRLIWFTSWSSLAAGMYAMYRDHAHLAIAPLFVWLTSLLYWRHPTNGWRRNLDMTAVKMALMWQLWNAGWRFTYAVITAMGIGFYFISNEIYEHGMHLESTIFHCGVYVLANLANFYLIVSEG